MLRIGLTGNLGSGKSTVAALFAAHGAHVLSSDAIGRELMQPGQPVFVQIVAHFGPHVLRADGALDRAELARLAFTKGRADELNAIVHPAVIARQAALAAQLSRHSPDAVLVIESALIFETRFAGGSQVQGSWRSRFDRILLVTAPENEKIARFVRRQQPEREPSEAVRRSLEADARQRLGMQMADSAKSPLCDYVIVNNASLEHLEGEVETVWSELTKAARAGL